MPGSSGSLEHNKAGLQDDHDPSELAQRQNNESGKQADEKRDEGGRSKSREEDMGFPRGDESKWG